MKIRFIRSHMAYRKGDIADVGGGEANVLIMRQIAVPEEQRTLLEMATVEPEARTAAVVKRKRGRPRKE